MLERNRVILERLLVLGGCLSSISQLLIEGRYRCCLSDNYIVSRHLHARADDTILV